MWRLPWLIFLHWKWCHPNPRCLYQTFCPVRFTSSGIRASALDTSSILSYFFLCNLFRFVFCLCSVIYFLVCVLLIVRLIFCSLFSPHICMIPIILYLFIFIFFMCLRDLILFCVFVSFLLLFLSHFCSCFCFLCLSDFV